MQRSFRFTLPQLKQKLASQIIANCYHSLNQEQKNKLDSQYGLKTRKYIVIDKQQIETKQSQKQKALWAYLFLKTIDECSDINFSDLKQKLLSLKLDLKDLQQFQKISLIAQSYMKGFFDFLSQKGPLLNSKVFNQERLNRKIFGKRIVYFPTQITNQIFTKIRCSANYSYIYYARGIGKSFSIMLYCQLTNLIIKNVVSISNQNQKQKTSSILKNNLIKKAFYWSIPQKKMSIEKQSQVLEKINQVFEQIIIQCDVELIHEISSEIKKFQQTLKQLLQQAGIKQRRAQKQKQSNKLIKQFISQISSQKCYPFYQLCKQLYKLCEKIKKFYNDRNINVILFIDQINLIAFQYQNIEKKLNQLNQFSKLSEQDQINYIYGRIYDDIRISLNPISDKIMHLSSINIENCYMTTKYQYRKDRIIKQLRHGTMQTKPVQCIINYKQILISKSYVNSMLKFIQFQFWANSNITKQLYQLKQFEQLRSIFLDELKKQQWISQYQIQPIIIHKSLSKLGFKITSYQLLNSICLPSFKIKVEKLLSLLNELHKLESNRIGQKQK